MLVVKRERGRKVVIRHRGEELILVVVRTQRGSVRLGFEASKSFDIIRDEALAERTPGEEPCPVPSSR